MRSGGLIKRVRRSVAQGPNFALGRLLAMPQQCPVSSLVVRESAAVRSVRRSSLSVCPLAGAVDQPPAGGGIWLPRRWEGSTAALPLRGAGRAGMLVNTVGVLTFG